MMTAYQPSTGSRIAFFIILFGACLLGSVGIFIFAVGIETGNRIVNDTMKVLVANAGWVLALFVVFNIAVWALYRYRR